MSEFFKVFRTLPFCVFGLISFWSYSQSFHLDVSISGLPNKNIHLSRIKGDQYMSIDTIAFKDGKLSYEMSGKNTTGMYTLLLDHAQPSDQYASRPVELIFIFNQEDISLKTSMASLIDSMQVLKSNENKVYFDFLYKEDNYQRKLELLFQFIQGYPQNDPFFGKAVAHYNKMQEEQKGFIDNTLNKAKNTFAARLISTYYMPYVDPLSADMTNLDFYLEHFFDYIDFKDEELINSNLYTDKAIRFLSMYRLPDASRLDQEKEFIKAVDVIMSKAASNPVVADFILDYLVRGFEKFKMEEVLNHISDTYVGENCETDDKSLLQKRLSAYQKMAIGKTAPDFVMKDINGNDAKLSTIESKYALLIFWASWCPHCKSLLQEINVLPQLEKLNIKVLTFSLDTNRNQWQEAVKSINQNWTHYSDLKGWNGDVQTKYNIYATPTMFLLDKKQIILAKPIDGKELKESLGKLK